jgi:hypothetical protein
MKFEARHWVAVGAFLVALAGVIGSLNSLSDALKPVFVAAVMTQTGAFLIALFSSRGPTSSNGGSPGAVKNFLTGR